MADANAYQWDISDGVGSELPDPAVQSYRVGSQAGDYVLEAALGQGGMGSVFRGRHVAVRCEHAVKLVFGLGGPGRERAWQRFEREGQALAALDHPAIARILDHGLQDGLTSSVNVLLPNINSITTPNLLNGGGNIVSLVNKLFFSWSKVDNPCLNVVVTKVPVVVKLAFSTISLRPRL